MKTFMWFWCLCQLWRDFTPSSSISAVDFEHVNAGWELGTTYQTFTYSKSTTEAPEKGVKYVQS